MSEPVVWQQGSGDGLCGLYALANFFRKVEAFEDEKDNAKQIVFLLLEQAHLHGWCAPHYLKEGFGPHHFKVIVNSLSESHGFPFRAETIQAYHLQRKEVRPYIYIKNLIETGGGAVVDWSDKEHWFLADEVIDGEIRLLDSDDAETTSKRLSARKIAAMGVPNDIVIMNERDIG